MERNYKIDFYKGLLILGVIYGHTITALEYGNGPGVWLHTMVRTYDMPFFMLISGYLMGKTVHKYVWYKHLFNKVGNIAIPTILVGGSLGIITCVLTFNFNFLDLVSYVANIWFVWSLLIISAIVILAEHFVKSISVRYTLYVLMACGLHFIPNDIYNLSYMFPFFIIGLSCGKFKKIESLLEKLGGITLPIFAVLLAFWSTKYTIWNTGGFVLNNTMFVIATTMFRFFIGLCGCLSMRIVYNVVYDGLSDSNYLKKQIIGFGENSLMIYIIHSFFISQCLRKLSDILLGTIGKNIFSENMVLLTIVIAPLVSLFVSVVILLRNKIA